MARISDYSWVPAPELAPGTPIGRYIVRGRIGRGGMGVVYEAHDPELDRTIAVKLLAPALHASSSSAQARTRLLREAQAMARLSHPNVIAVYDVGTFGEQVFVAMERIEGVTLAAWLAERPRSWQEVLAVFCQAGAGLSAAHAAGLIHRDFKPDNVLVDRGGRARVLDFGLARSANRLLAESVPETSESDPAVLGLAETLDAGASETEEASRQKQSPGLLASPLTATGTLLGTPLYMSPEQHRREPTDARSDQFSFCVALYEALCGERPFRGTTLAALGLAAVQGDMIDVPRGARVPERIRKAVLRGLMPRPSDRFASMEALLTNLSPDHGPSRRAFVAAGAAAAVLATAGVFARLRGRSSIPTPVTYRQLTFTGQSRTPRFSLDGSRLAYASGNEIRVRDLASGADVVVHETLKSGVGFHWFSKSELALEDTNSLVLVPTEGGSTRRIDWEHSRSPDGSRVLDYTPTSKELIIINITTEEQTTLAIQGEFLWLLAAVWSPRGDALLVWTWQSGKDTISTITLDGAVQTKVVEDVEVGPPVWAPRGDSFYYVRGRNELIKVPLGARATAAGPAVTLLTGLDTSSDIQVSADGRTLVYTRGGPRAGVWLANAEKEVIVPVQATSKKGGSTLSRIQKISVRAANRSALSVSPDGKLVAFGQTDASANVFTLELDSGAQHQITTGKDFAMIFATAWSPNGRDIACTVRLHNGNEALYRVTVDGGSLKLLREAVSVDLAWAPGLQILVQTVSNRDFEVIDPGTGIVRPLRSSNDGWSFSPCVSPNGKNVALFINQNQRGVYLVSVADGTSRLLVEGELTPAGFNANGTSVYVITGKYNTELVAIAIETGAATPLGTLPFENGATSVVNVPGTTRFVCLVDESNSDIWAVDGFDPESAL